MRYSESGLAMSSAKLSGSDYFHLLIDRKMKRFGLAGNISRVHFQLDSDADLTQIATLLKSNSWLKSASRIRYKLSWPSSPKWIKTEEVDSRVILSESISQTVFQEQILNRNVDNTEGLVCVDLCSQQDGSKDVVVSMHHALFDHQGMMNFIDALNDNFDGNECPELEPFGFWNSAVNAFNMTFYMLSRGSSKLGSLLKKSSSKNSLPRYDQLILTLEETKQVEANAWQTGSRIGTSAYLISSVAKTVDLTLQNRNEHAPYLWFSTPHNQRKLGTKGHLFSNQLSFLFFKLTVSDLDSKSASIKALNTQLKQQIKNQITAKYAGLMAALRYVPLSIYELMVNRSANGKLASFGFSDLGKDQLEMETFCGQKVKNVFRYPPVATPPGFNVAVVRSKEQFEFVFGYLDEAISESGMNQFKIDFKNRLLGIS